MTTVVETAPGRPAALARPPAHDLKEMAVLALLTLISRIPFLGVGYGSDPDAWRLAAAAQRIHRTGIYSYSREPGHPLQELIASLAISGGPWLLNGLTALLSVLATVSFARSLRLLGYKHHLLPALAMACTPVVFVNSTNSMDYIWALGFLLASFHAVLLQRPARAGVLLGLAVGCRITSGAMLLPLAWLLHAVTEEPKLRPRRLLALLLATVLVAGALYLPVYRAYGPGFFTFVDSPRPWQHTTAALTWGVWGDLGTLALAAGLLLAIVSVFRPPADRARPPGLPLIHPLIWGLVVLLYLIGFLRLPHDAGYLIPLVPFVILLLSWALDRRSFRWICLTLIISAVIGFDRSGPTAGPVLTDQTARVRGTRTANQVLAAGRQLADKSLVVVGWHLPQIEVSGNETATGPVIFKYRLNAQELAHYQQEGYRIYFLAGMDRLNRAANGLDLRRAGATPLRIRLM